MFKLLKIIFIFLLVVINIFLVIFIDIKELKNLIYSLYILDIIFGFFYINILSSKRFFSIENHSIFIKDFIMINHYMIFPLTPLKSIFIQVKKISSKFEIYLIFALPVLIYLYFLSLDFIFITLLVNYIFNIIMLLVFIPVVHMYFKKYMVVILEILFLSLIIYK